MAVSYAPDPGAVPRGTAATAWLSQRDLGLGVSIPFVTHAGVSLRHACFPQDSYLFQSGLQCLSNLLASGFQRVLIDIYWDPTSSTWSLCPAELGASSAQASNNASSSSFSISTTYLPTAGASQLQARQLASSPAIALITSSSSAPTSSSSSTPSPSDVYQVGPYRCNSNLTFSAVNELFLDHFAVTSNDVNASIKYMILNLHRATAFSEIFSSSFGSAIPGPEHAVSTLLNSTLANYLYTPYSLMTQRADLNASWYSPSSELPPAPGYFDLFQQVDVDQDQFFVSSPNAWPDEGYIELDRAKRLLVGYGSIDPALSAYNTSFDASTIFASDQLSVYEDVTVGVSGAVTKGCFAFTGAKTVAGANNSFAQSSNLFGPSASINSTEAAAVVACGISAVLNGTLSNATADVDPQSYADFAMSAIWSWAIEQPNDTDDDDRHCAVLNMSAALTSGRSGKWQVADCSSQYYGVCRRKNEPYSWTPTTQKAGYTTIDDACPDDSTFDVPRTSLENGMLISTLEPVTNLDFDSAYRVFWLDFNDLDVSDCWVNGINNTCPYTRRRADQSRTVAVPVVSAVIVLVIAALTLFVKCAGNRKTSRSRKRRIKNETEYEGIPS